MWECVAYFDLVFYMLNQAGAAPGEVQRAFQTYGDGQIIAKGDAALAGLEAPNWSSVLKKYRDGSGAKSNG